MDYQKYKDMPNAEVPADIQNAISCGGAIHETAFKDKNGILHDLSLHSDCGFLRFENGNYLVAMYCPMPGVTAEMINWWFWWHPQADERYQLWFPGEHFKIHYSAEDADYFEQEKQPEFRPNSQYPTELIGKIKMPLRIDFVSPESFGFDSELLYKSNVETAVCGHVSAFGGLIPHTEMAHIFFHADDGLFMISRFWIGQTLKNPLIRRFILNDDTAKGMAKHCCIEYRNLVRKLPELYEACKSNGAVFTD